MASNFRYDDLPVELKLKVLEHVFVDLKGPPPIHIRALNVRKTYSYRLSDEYFDTFYNCVIPSEVTIYPDARFRQLFVSKDFLEHAIPIFASQNRLELQLSSYRTTTGDPKRKSHIVQQTLKEIISHVREITITHTLLARENHLDVQRLITLVSPSRLRQCNMVLEKPRFWFRDHPDLRTTIVGHLLSFAFHRNNDLQVLTEKEITSLRDDKQPPMGLMDLLRGQHAPSELTWHREEMLAALKDQGFTGSGWLQIDIVASRHSNSQIPLMPTSYVCISFLAVGSVLMAPSF